jgi:hypothetical protein
MGLAQEVELNGRSSLSKRQTKFRPHAAESIALEDPTSGARELDESR